AVAVEVVDLGDRERADRRDQHGLHRLAGGVVQREAQRHRRGQGHAPLADLYVAAAADGHLGQSVVLTGRTADPQPVADGDIGVVGGVAGQVDEDAVRGGAAGDRPIAAAAGSLQVDAVVAAGAVV